MAKVTTFWADFTLEDLDAALPEGVDIGDLVAESAFTTDNGKTVTIEFVQKDN